MLAIVGIAAAWGMLSLTRTSTVGWMALLLAVDSVFMAYLAGEGPSKLRAWFAVTITALGLLFSGFCVAALRIGIIFGTFPHEALFKIDPTLAWTWWRLNHTGWDVIWFVLSLPLAWFLGRRGLR